MKRVLFIIVFMVLGSFGVMAAPGTCSSPAGPPKKDCSQCPGGPVSVVGSQSYCCANGGNQIGCLTTSAPINKGLIFLLIAGVGLGSVVVYRNSQSKLV